MQGAPGLLRGRPPLLADPLVHYRGLLGNFVSKSRGVASASLRIDDTPPTSIFYQKFPTIYANLSRLNRSGRNTAKVCSSNPRLLTLSDASSFFYFRHANRCFGQGWMKMKEHADNASLPASLASGWLVFSIAGLFCFHQFILQSLPTLTPLFSRPQLRSASACSCFKRCLPFSMPKLL